MKKMAVFVLALIASPALSASWQSFGRSNNGNDFFYDAASMRIVGKETRVWVRTELPKNSKTKEASRKDLLALNCQERTYDLLQSTDYDANGDLLKTNNYADLARSNTAIIPESVMDALASEICINDPANRAVAAISFHMSVFEWPFPCQRFARSISMVVKTSTKSFATRAVRQSDFI